MRSHSIVIDQDKCLGCTSCMKSCPTEAIRVHARNASIIGDICIDCGTCMSNCPHNAISTEPDTLSSLSQFKYTVALPDPALYGQFQNLEDTNLVLNALLEIGFDDVYEPAAAAEMIAHYTSVPRLRMSQRKFSGPIISSCCPAILRLIRIKFPSLISNVVNTVTPLELAAILARRRAAEKTGLDPSEIGIIGIVPCASQVTAAHNPETLKAPVIDAAIAVREVYAALLEPMRKLADKKLKPLVMAAKSGVSHAYAGGEARARLANDYLAVDGIQNSIKMLSDIEDDNIPNADYIELNACVQGCVGGCLNVSNPYSARLRLKHMEKNMELYNPYNELTLDDIKLIDADKDLEYIPALLLDNDRTTAMEMMNKIIEFRKHLPGMDCGSCGAPNCNAFAKDVIRGKASADDCIFKIRARMIKIAGQDKLDEILPVTMRE